LSWRMSRSSWPSSSSMVAMRGGIPRVSMLGARMNGVNPMRTGRCSFATAPVRSFFPARFLGGPGNTPALPGAPHCA